MDSLGGYVATGVVSLLVGLALRSLEPKIKIVWWSPHRFLFKIPIQSNPPANLFTHAITVQNLGRKSAEWVEIVHKTKPDFFMLEPALNYKETQNPSGEHVIKIESLGPREFFTVEFLSYTAIAELLFIRTEVGHAQFITIQPQRSFPRWVQRTLSTITVIGLGFVVYWLLRVSLFIGHGIGIL